MNVELRYGSLFSGYLGLDEGVQSVLGGRTAWVSDVDPGACKILAHRAPDAPNLGDISVVDFRDVEPVDVLTGGFPCQDVSYAGLRAGIAPGTRSGLWSEMARAIQVLRPRLVVAENVRGLLSADAVSDLEPCPWCVGDGSGGALRALGAVLGDLADLGYDARWYGLRAADVGAPHGRFRVFVFAWPATDTRSETVGLGAGLRAGGPGGVGWGRPDHGDTPGAAADTNGLRDPESIGRHTAAGIRDLSVTDAASNRRDQRRPEPAGVERGPDAAERGDVDSNAVGERRVSTNGGDDGVRSARLVARYGSWGDYEPAIRRWEHITERLAPAPTELGAKGAPRLSPRFVEWMMGLPAGWVTDVPDLTRNAQLKALGNGVVLQQAAAATAMWVAEHVRKVAA